MIVTVMMKRVIETQIFIEIHIDKKTFISHISLNISMIADFRFILRRHQYFIHLKFEMFINKAQSQPLN